MGLVRLTSGRETVHKLICEISGKLDVDRYYGDNKATERDLERGGAVMRF